MMTRAIVLTVSMFVAMVAAEPAAAQAEQDEVVYYHLDGVGSVRAVTDATGQEVARLDYLPFGEAWPNQNSQEARQFTGGERDQETGFDYFGARSYHSQTGRFTTPDIPGIDQSLSDPQSWNLYAYVRNNPVRYVDPTGRKCENGYNAETGAFCTETIGEDPWQAAQRFFLDSWMNVQHQLTAAQATTSAMLSRVQSLIPSVCGGGGFGYAGVGAHAGRVHGEILGLVQYDSQDGGAHGGLIGVGAGHFTGGFESMRTWNDWQAHTSPIVLGGIEIPGASRQFGKKINVASGDVGGLAQYENGSVSLGFYSGVTFGSGRAFGGGAYGTLSWNACR